MTEYAQDEDEFVFENAAENPSLMAAAEALVSQASSSSDTPPDLEDPLDGPVTLPAGFRRVKGEGQFEEVRKAWVRELNGEDEERIARARLKDDVHEFILAVLEAGVERLGDTRPTKADLDALVVGDRSYLLLEIARVTYGDTFKFDQIVCYNCNETFDAEISLGEDVPVDRLDKVEDSTFEIPLRKDRIAKVTLPNGEIAALAAKAETPAEANTIYIAHCVDEIRGPKGSKHFGGDVGEARKLGVVDRQTIVTEMGKRMPGPQYDGIRFNHEPGCGKEIRLAVSLTDLFRGL